MNIILVGHGSIGSIYKSFLMETKGINKDNLHIIETKKIVRDKLISEGFKCYSTIKSLNKENIVPTHSVVANWGPDHVNSAKQLIKLGCNRLIIEKPVSHRLDEFLSLKKISSENNIYVTVHHYWKLVECGNAIRKIQIKHDLGKPVGVRMIAGAACLSTNGIHDLDLCCDVLDSYPETVLADLQIDHINPRDKSLCYVGGVASFKMANDTFTHVSYTNKNSQTSRFEAIYKHGIIEIDLNGKLICFKRKQKDLDKSQGLVTRHGLLEKREEIPFEEIDTIPLIIDDLLHGKTPKVSLNRSEKSLRMLLGALKSNAEGKKVDCYNFEDSGVRIS